VNGGSFGHTLSAWHVRRAGAWTARALCFLLVRVSLRRVLRIPCIFLSYPPWGTAERRPRSTRTLCAKGYWSASGTLDLPHAVGVAFFAFAAYRLVRRRAGVRLVYVVAALHGLNVVLRGLRPIDIVLWLAISGTAVTKFRKQERVATKVA
jgi:hypothetical protein